MRPKLYWHVNLARRPLTPTWEALGFWALLTVVAIGFLGLDLGFMAVELHRVFRLYQHQQRYERQIRAWAQRIERIRETVRRTDTPRFRKECAFFTEQLRARSFRWTTMLQRLEAILPTETRLLAIAPTRLSERRRETAARVVTLSVEARNAAGFQTFLRRLYRLESFSDIRVQREQFNPQGGFLRYEVQAVYRPTPGGYKP